MEKTLNAELKAVIFATTSPELMKSGFSLKLAKDRFVRKRGEVTDLFQLVCLDGRPGYRIQPNVGVRIERVENIFHQTSGFESKYQKDTLTTGNSIGIYLTGDSRSCEFFLGSQSEIPAIAEKLIAVFRDFALPYFERWGTLAAIDAELNDKPSERTHHRPLAWERCSTGVITAKLVGRSDYDRLVTFYTQVMTENNKGFYLKRFQALLKTLESVEPGSSLPSKLSK
jgi:hypothetical protein